MSLQTTSAISFPVMEHFYTLQGEGFHQGKAAYFIRLGGCDVGCVWCDVKDSWDADKHPAYSIQELLSEVKKTPAQIAVITGGEPLLHNLDAVSYTHLRAHETVIDLVCRLLLGKKKTTQ